MRSVLLTLLWLWSAQCLCEEKLLKLSPEKSKVLLSVESQILSFKAQGVPTQGEALFTEDFFPKEISIKGSSKNLAVQRGGNENLQTQLLLTQLLSTLPEGVIKAQSKTITKAKEKDLFLMKGVVSTSSTHSPMTLTMKLTIFSDSIQLSGKTMKEGIEFPPSSPLSVFQGSIKGDAEIQLVFLR